MRTWPRWGSSIKWFTLFWPIFTPLLPVTLCHTSRDPLKVRHTSRTTRFLVVQKARTKPPVQNLSQRFAGFFPGVLFWVFCLEAFVRGSFVRSPSVRIHPFQQKVKHHFKFHASYVWQKHLKAWRQMLLDPLPLSQTVTLSRTPSSVAYFMDGPMAAYLSSVLTIIN